MAHYIEFTTPLYQWNPDLYVLTDLPRVRFSGVTGYVPVEDGKAKIPTSIREVSGDYRAYAYDEDLNTYIDKIFTIIACPKPEGYVHTDDEVRTYDDLDERITANETELENHETRITALEAGGGGGTGAVSSVNGQTGAVVLDAEDVGAATEAQGEKADTALQPGALDGYAKTTDLPTIDESLNKESTNAIANGAVAAEFEIVNNEIQGKVGYAEYADNYLYLYDSSEKTKQIAKLLIEGGSTSGGISEAKCREIITSYGYAVASDFYSKTEIDSKISGKQDAVAATSSDIGSFLSPKTVSGGVVTAWQFITIPAASGVSF